MLKKYSKQLNRVAEALLEYETLDGQQIRDLCKGLNISIKKSDDKDEQKKAEEIDKILQPVQKSLFIESNPSPVKYAAKLIGLCDDNVRLPLVKVLEQTKTEVKKALLSAKLINE